MGLFAGSRKGIFILSVLFYALVGIFIVIASVIAIPAFKRYMSFPFLAISGTAFFLLGVALIFLTLKQKVGGMLKKFLILTGASSAGFFVSVLLHNAIYGLFIRCFGADFWNRIGVKDEPFFFIVAIFVCPIGFLVGVVGSIVLFIKKRKGEVCDMREEVLLSSELPGIKPFKKGKVRDLYDLQDRLLIVATDRISAFDVVLPNGIPLKGRVLTALSEFWFNYTKEIISNHLITTDIKEFPEELKEFSSILEGRSMLVKKAKMIEIECVVRGYLAGSGWREYKEKGSISGVKLPPGLRESEKLPQLIFTPATKAKSGHDINITQEEMGKSIGKEVAQELKEKSLEIYKSASQYVESKGLIISDTKLEFGFSNNEIILIDELLTPDSSRFWPREDYEVGRAQRSFDKQFVRDYLENLSWDKKSPAPLLPPEIIEKTSQKYQEAYKKITGLSL